MPTLILNRHITKEIIWREISAGKCGGSAEVVKQSFSNHHNLDWFMKKNQWIQNLDGGL